MNYPKAAIYEWFHKVFGVNASQGDELKTTCPKCNHENFYFNLKKQTGWCHRASCHYAPLLEDLIDRAGFAPDQFGGSLLPPEQKAAPPITLPGSPVLTVSDQGEHFTYYPEVVSYLHRRGLSNYDILRYNLTFDQERIYIPIYKEGKLFSYIGRDFTGQSSKKYKYASGVNVTSGFFGWNECKQWPKLTLVENTFVSIWLRNDCYCTTNFGSYLSKAQVNLIRRSKVRSVAILWDENAHISAVRAVKALRPVCGAAFVWMKGQPDDYPKETIVNIAEQCHQAALEGREEIDPFNVKMATLHKTRS